MRKLVWGSLLLVVLAGCIRPLPEPTPTPDGFIPIDTGGIPTVDLSAPSPTPQVVINTPPPTTDSSNLPSAIFQADLPIMQAYLETAFAKSISPGTFSVWKALQVGSDLVVGIAYKNPSGLPCIGVVMANRQVSGVLNPFNGEASCATDPNQKAVVGSWFLLTWGTNQPLTATVGEVFNLSQAVQSASISYPDGGTLSTTDIVNNRFIYVRSGSLTASSVQFNTAEGVEAQAPIVP